MGTLQEALLKVGLVTEERAKQLLQKEKKPRPAARPARPRPPEKAPPAKTGPVKAKGPRAAGPRAAAPRTRPKDLGPPPKPKERMHEHQIRTQCDACGKGEPDVEYYQHNNKRLGKYWLCIQCADNNEILDETRQTHQSSHSIRGMFQRRYGPTKAF